jgi:hypothetical protein
VIDDSFMVHQVASKLTIRDDQLLQLRNLYATYVPTGEGKIIIVGDDPMAPNVGDGLPLELLPWNQEPLKDPNPDKETITGPGGLETGFPARREPRTRASSAHAPLAVAAPWRNVS